MQHATSRQRDQTAYVGVSVPRIHSLPTEDVQPHQKVCLLSKFVKRGRKSWTKPTAIIGGAFPTTEGFASCTIVAQFEEHVASTQSF